MDNKEVVWIKLVKEAHVFWQVELFQFLRQGTCLESHVPLYEV